MLYLKQHIGNSILGIWKVEETCEELLASLDHEEWLDLVLVAKSASRKREMLATRVLVKEILGEEKHIQYLQSGCPYLADDSYKISISHTKGYVAIALDRNKTMGLDIEQRTDKIFRVRDRVITKYDYIDPTNEQVHLLLHWSAKEAMFKYLDSEGIDFRRNLHVEQFIPQTSGKFQVSESKTKERQEFDAHYFVNDHFVMVCLMGKTFESPHFS